jgi:hypothetical protein
MSADTAAPAAEANSIQLSTLGASAVAAPEPTPAPAPAPATVTVAAPEPAAPHPHVPTTSAHLDDAAAPKLRPSAAQQAMPASLHLSNGAAVANGVPATPINPRSDFTPAAERKEPTPTDSRYVTTLTCVVRMVFSFIYLNGCVLCVLGLALANTVR